MVLTTSRAGLTGSAASRLYNQGTWGGGPARCSTGPGLAAADTASTKPATDVMANDAARDLGDPPHIPMLLLAHRRAGRATCHRSSGRIGLHDRNDGCHER
ncbi:MAG: hypothetical protein NVS3B26_26530 [Mycobacteriales bacterium]